MIIDRNLLDKVSEQAKDSPRLRMRSALPLCPAKNSIFISLWMRSAIAF